MIRVKGATISRRAPRPTEEHTPTGLVVDHFHAAPENSMELTLQPVIRTKWGREAESLDLGMEHLPHARLPQIGLDIGNSEKRHYVAMTFEEADQLRAHLDEFIARGREYAQPDAVASLQEPVDYCDVRIVACERHAKGFHGHAVGDTRHGGPVWVTVPKDTTGPRLEELVTRLLAEVHETQQELTTPSGAEVRQAGEPPEPPSWLVGKDAA
ncbi:MULTISPECIES: hypothetical protein [unclassified Streptomyces]|uniref:hypothetical protein n=1 Tax=unclassified Streptomyces TaxID=2593676 RepID=UPI00131A4948|nr:MULTISPECIES: hypothetical protein [unclassified Streptomyces]